jgi:hypothetical protein
MHTFKVPDQKCPTCGTKLSAATAVKHDDSPKPGSLTVCIECGTVLEFSESMELRVMTPEQVAELAPEMRQQLQGLSGAKQHAAYANALRKLALAAVAWVEAHKPDGLAFSLPPADVMFIAPLTDDTIAMLAANRRSRSFLRALDRATKMEATAFQAAQVIRAMGLPVTDWPESYVAELVARGSDFITGRKAGQA